MDLGAVKAAATPVLAKSAVSAAANGQELLGDAEWLSAGARRARAYALAALAVEEVGKAVSLSALAVMPVSLREQAPLGRMLAWHQLKLVGGMLLTLLPSRTRTVAAQLAEMSPDQISGIMDNVQALAQDQDTLKQRGLYVDIDRGGRVRLPSEVSEAEVAAQLDQARQAVSAASALLEPRTPAWLANPPAESIELCQAIVGAFAHSGYRRTPQAAVSVFRDAVRKFHEQTAAGHGRTRSSRTRRT